MILVIDNFDSFVFNLARYCECLGHEVRVVRNNEWTVEQVGESNPQAIILSPGPCTPNEAGISLEVVRNLGGTIPILGVRLGHQTIAQAYGARVVRSPEPMHGRTSLIYHQGQSVFANLPSPLQVCRYHSLIADDHDWPAQLEVLAQTASGIVMAVQHRRHPVVGLQFHPESILTPCGFDLLRQFFAQFGIAPRRANIPAPSSLWQRELSCSAGACQPPESPVVLSSTEPIAVHPCGIGLLAKQASPADRLKESCGG